MMSEEKASEGTLALFMSRDSDGDPRWRIYDDKGDQVASGHTVRGTPFAYKRAAWRGKRRLQREIEHRRSILTNGAICEIPIVPPEPEVVTICAECSEPALPEDFLCKAHRKKAHKDR